VPIVSRYPIIDDVGTSQTGIVLADDDAR